MGRRSKLSVRQRSELVLQLLRKEDSGAQLARQAGVSVQTLYRWRDDFLSAGQAALSGARRGADEAQFNRQLAQRDQVIGELTVANRILKKISGSPS